MDFKEFFWASPIALKIYDAAALQALYEEGAEKYQKTAVEKCYREILAAVYRGNVGNLEIMLEAWNPSVHAKIEQRLRELFPSLGFSWKNSTIVVECMGFLG